MHIWIFIIIADWTTIDHVTNNYQYHHILSVFAPWIHSHCLIEYCISSGLLHLHSSLVECIRIPFPMSISNSNCIPNSNGVKDFASWSDCDNLKFFWEAVINCIFSSALASYFQGINEFFISIDLHWTSIALSAVVSALEVFLFSFRGEKWLCPWRADFLTWLIFIKERIYSSYIDDSNIF